MTDQTVDQQTDGDDPKIAVLQAVVDRVTSWQDGADESTVRQELDQAVADSDVEVDESTKERVVSHIVEKGSHVDVRTLLD
jgi:hypothetical protein